MFPRSCKSLLKQSPTYNHNMGKLYQVWDEGLFDYGMYTFEEVEVRGPKPKKRGHICCIGAAQTFGRYCHDPFPNIIGASLNVGVLNFGIGGAGPEFFLAQKRLLEAANQCEVVVVQVLSARSVSNSVFRSTYGGRDGMRVVDGKQMPAEQIFADLLTGKDPRGHDSDFVAQLLNETQLNYVTGMRRLLASIDRPKILFWFSVRHPERKHCPPRLSMYYLLDWLKRCCASARLISPCENLFGCFPQLVNATMVESLRTSADYYVECVTHVGLPLLIKAPLTRTVRWNNYYPSPSMHRTAAAALLPICQRVLAS